MSTYTFSISVSVHDRSQRLFRLKAPHLAYEGVLDTRGVISTLLACQIPGPVIASALRHTVENPNSEVVLHAVQRRED